MRLARGQGVHHYLVKPFRMQALHERLDEVWRSHERDIALLDSEELDQTAVDSLLHRDALAAAGQRKGVSPVTLELVAQALAQQAEAVSAGTLAETLGMSRVSARRYLEHMVDAGLAVREPVYGQTGRPQVRYSTRT